MKKVFKVWVHVEQYVEDDDEETHDDDSQPPLEVAVFDDRESAWEFAHSLDRASYTNLDA